MQSYEFETMCRWIAARLRARGVDVEERDPRFMDAVSALRLRGVAEAVAVDGHAIARLAARLSPDLTRAA